jgi:hypothetical protein
VCLALLVWMIVQFNGFYRGYLTDYPVVAAFWFDGNHPGAFDPIIAQHSPNDSRFIYFSTSLPRIKDHWKLYLIRRGRTDLLKRTIYFSQQDIHLYAVRPGSLLLTGADDPVERSFRRMPSVKAIEQIAEPDGTPSFTIFERTSWSGFDRFDGIYSAKVDVACTAGEGQTCRGLATTTTCPSMETITVTNGLAVDSCGYLTQSDVGDDGLYTAVSTYGIPVTGTFSTKGIFRLSGSGVSGGSRYELTFEMTKRN